MFDNAGQDCCARSRILVQRSVFDRFMALLEPAVKAVAVGDPGSPDTEMGPLVSGAHRDVISPVAITKLAVGKRSALTTARVRPRSARLNAAMLVATTMSQPKMRLALPGPMRTLARSSADGAMRT